MSLRGRTLSFAVTLLYVFSGAALAQITDFTEWTQITDPFDADFTGSVISTQATLTAGNGAIADMTDIAYQSVDGLTPATATSGYSFDPASDFALGIDYTLTFSGSPIGLLALGLGIGEDAAGANSAGIALGTVNGVAAGKFAGAARVGDVDKPEQETTLDSSLSGSLFVSYDATSGDITVGASQTPGAANATATTTFNAIQDEWAGGDLLVAFFLRSESPTGWLGGGTGEAVFSNLRISEGAATEVPEPASLVLMGIGGLAMLSRKRTQ